MGDTTYAQLQQEVLREFPKFSHREKANSLLMKCVHALLLTLTLGGMSCFQRDVTTTIGYTVYVPTSWGEMSEVAKIIILRHERVHMRQRKKYGALLFSFLYAFFPLPCVFSYFRMKFEMEAYAESLRAMAEMGCQVGGDGQKSRLVGYFVGPAYFWAWPFRRRIESWYDGSVRAVTKAH
jgi:hypothetical protein